jgi:uncharacterized membrane protein YdbT with pleckstrin-like domain
MKRSKKSSLRKTIKGKSGKRTPSSFVCPAFILPEERIIFKTNPHWLFIVAPEVALLAFGILLLKYLSSFLPEQIPYARWLLVLFGAAWSFVMLVIFLYWINIRYYLTNLRLIEERGIIGKRIMSIWLDKVQDVTCKFGILGRIFGFGDIEIESAGTYGKIVFSFLPLPQKLQAEIEKAIFDSR